MKEHQDISGPPGAFLSFLRWFCDPRLIEDVEGDLSELYYMRAEKNLPQAKWLFILDVLLLLRPGIIRNFSFRFHPNNFAMFRNHFKTAVRHSFRYKGYTFINLTGLIIGMTASFLILLWVRDEVSMDKFHKNSDRLYEAWRNMYQADGSVITTPYNPEPLEAVLKDAYSEIDQVSLLGWQLEKLISNNDRAYYEKGCYASPEFFKIFSFSLLAGNPATALDNTSSIVISQSLAVKLFGEQWQETVLGHIIKIDNAGNYEITGVFNDPGRHSSLQFDWIMPARRYIKDNQWTESWYNGSFRIFFTLKDPADLDRVQDRVAGEIRHHTNNQSHEKVYLQKFTDTYLYSSFENGRPVKGRIIYVRIMLGIAIFLLVIACVNFMNLATARSVRRMKEIGIRKVLGAEKGILRRQFLMESFLQTIVAVMSALLLVILLIPSFNMLTGKTLSPDLADPTLWTGVILIILITGFLSGSYPALLLPSFKVTNSLKGKLKQRSSDKFLRNSLVVFQFALSILLIIGTLVVSSQVKYILNKELGLDKENLLYINLTGDLQKKAGVYKTELLKIPEVKDVTLTSGNPIEYERSTGGATWPGKDPDALIEVNILITDHDFFRTMGMNIIKGRNFDRDMVTDTSNFMVNETMARVMGFQNPVGKELSFWGMKGNIIGMVKDFNISDLYESYQPVIIMCDPGSTSEAFIRTQNNVADAIRGIEKVSRTMNPAFPFRYTFLDQEYAETYRSEKMLATLVNLFAAVSIFISCLGLLGLSSLSVEQRTKEIGVRRVHGARTFQLVVILSRHYALLMFTAFILAVPAAWYYTGQWLDNFAFRIHPGYWIYLIAGLIAFLTGILTVGLKSYKAAMANPVRTLKEE